MTLCGSRTCHEEASALVLNLTLTPKLSDEIKMTRKIRSKSASVHAVAYASATMDTAFRVGATSRLHPVNFSDLLFARRYSKHPLG